MWNCIVGHKVWLRNNTTRKHIKELIQEGQDKGLPVKILDDNYVAFNDLHIYIWSEKNIKRIEKLIKTPTLESYGMKGGK